MAEVYKKTSREIVFEEFDKDLVILNLATGQYFGLNDAGAALWRELMQGASPDDVICSGSETEAADFVGQLLEYGLVVAETGSPVPSQLKLTGSPTIDAFDDLSDLILADPIHDVDEDAGWPKQVSDAS